jgi:8-oxo-dGTP diphosphatase
MGHFCYHCGETLTTKSIDGRDREVCPRCGWINYEHRKVSAAVRIVVDGKLLLVQRGIEPWKGSWYMPAGYLEVDEDPKTCAAREVKEETGYNVRVGELIDIYTYEDDPRGNGIVLLYDGEISGGEIQDNTEMLQVRFFTPVETHALAKSGTGGRKQVEDWVNEEILKSGVPQ